MTDRHEPALDPLLDRLRRQHFIIYQFEPHQTGPDVMAAVHYWGEVADVVILWDASTAWAYRMPITDDEGREYDTFAPQLVYWWYAASPGWTVLKLLELPQPAHPLIPADLIETPKGFGVPREVRGRIVARASHRR